jgi:hypothetical protein
LEEKKTLAEWISPIFVLQSCDGGQPPSLPPVSLSFSLSERGKNKRRQSKLKEATPQQQLKL